MCVNGVWVDPLVVLGSSEMRETVRITFRFDASAASTVS